MQLALLGDVDYKRQETPLKLTLYRPVTHGVTTVKTNANPTFWGMLYLFWV